MKYITLDENGMHINFRIKDNDTVELVDFSAIQETEDLRIIPPFIFGNPDVHGLVSVQIDGESNTSTYANKHCGGSENCKFKYQGHTLEKNDQGKLLTITMKTDAGLQAIYHMQLFDGISIVRTWTTLKNLSDEDIGLDYVTSFYYDGLCKNGKKHSLDKMDVLVPTSNWNSEAQWHTHDIIDLGLSRMGVCGHGLFGVSNARYHYSSNCSWSSCEYMPMGMVKDRETGEIYYYEIDYSGTWRIEIGTAMDNTTYLALLGPDDENFWWKNLKPGMEFTTVPACFGIKVGDETDAAVELTKYRRAIRREIPDLKKCSLVFNDYMNCLQGDITEENEKMLMDYAAELGCEYFCMDAGWYDKGFWWDKIGEWKESPERFPNGLKSLYDYARSKGLKMGMWLEIENMGIASDVAAKLPDDWFFCKHGKRNISTKRYSLDFRNPEVRKYCREVIDRLVRDYGCEYFKIDYNVITGTGSDLNSDSLGDAMLEHYRALYDWYKEIFAAYPDIIIENCSTGGQRMDYGMLSLHGLESISDQTDYIFHSFVASNVVSALTPEQAGAWVYPYENDREHVIYNVVNAMLIRFYCSGRVWELSPENLALYKEGIDAYKSIRGDIHKMLPFFPLGFTTIKSDTLAYGLKDENRAFLSVFTPYSDYAEIPLKHIPSYRSVKVFYPSSGDCEYKVEDGMLKIKMPQKSCARTFVFEL